MRPRQREFHSSIGSRTANPSWSGLRCTALAKSSKATWRSLWVTWPMCRPDPDDPRGTKPRLFAVRSPALPLDITDAVLWRWSKASGKDFAKAVQLFSLVTPAEKDGRLELQLEFLTEEKDWPDKTRCSTGLGQVVGHHARNEGERRRAQGFALGHAVH